MQKKTGGQTRWWWLSYFGVDATWSAEERKVRIALGMSTLPIIMVVFFIADALLEWCGVERNGAALLAGLISMVLGFCSARPIATVLYPDLLRTADFNAEKRLSRKAHE